MKETPFLIGLSGPSSSGKTTAARLLRRICNTKPPVNESSPSISLFILHEDDFYKTDTEIPIVEATSAEHGTRDLQDWDCIESLDLPLFESTLHHVKETGSLPPDTVSKEDQNEVGESGVSEETVMRLHDEMQKFANELQRRRGGKTVRICMLDGFLLYTQPPGSNENAESSVALPRRLHNLISDTLDLKLFFPSTREQTITRRAARSGYVTLEGFWADPPGYVEDVVWPNYARDHGWMFRDGEIDDFAVSKEGIMVAPGKGKRSVEELMSWAVERVKEGLNGIL